MPPDARPRGLAQEGRIRLRACQRDDRHLAAREARRRTPSRRSGRDRTSPAPRRAPGPTCGTRAGQSPTAMKCSVSLARNGGSLALRRSPATGRPCRIRPPATAPKARRPPGSSRPASPSGSSGRCRDRSGIARPLARRWILDGAWVTRLSPAVRPRRRESSCGVPRVRLRWGELSEIATGPGMARTDPGARESGRIALLRPYTANAPSRARLLLKYLMFPGTNWVSRDKSRLVKMFLKGTPERPVRTLDCGCGNAYFAHQAVIRGGRCLGITIHEWEKDNCEEMRDFLGIPEERLDFRVASLDRARRRPRDQRPVRPGPAARRDRAHHGRPQDVPPDPRPARRGRVRLHHDPRPRLAGATPRRSG